MEAIGVLIFGRTAWSGGRNLARQDGVSQCGREQFVAGQGVGKFDHVSDRRVGPA
ncbi:MAG TPA: hypothetical protein VHR39_06995 [Propionibacteriaceae bacterium]|nr:hypothetical protein [Propionibacteriaceae bacterium]